MDGLATTNTVLFSDAIVAEASAVTVPTMCSPLDMLVGSTAAYSDSELDDARRVRHARSDVATSGTTELSW